ncbi:MAG: hypothetical protein JMDDDDMK_03770 [Acidobacteria bacterium]|nr:hypothetical protein [Acidobacteriota bacterium]
MTVEGNDKRITTARSGLKPGSVCQSLRKLRDNKPAPASSAIVNASCAITNAPRRRPPNAPADCPRPPSFNAACASCRPKRNAGKQPSATPISTASAQANNNTRPSTFTGFSRGKLPCSSRNNTFTPKLAINAPAPAAVIVNSRFSTINCRATRQRPAPNAARTANSRCRAVSCASSKLAAFAQATSNNKPTAPSNSHKPSRTLRVRCSCKGANAKSVMAKSGAASISPPFSRRNCLPMTLASARACSSVTPARSRPTTGQLCAVRDVLGGSMPVVTQTSVSAG